MAYLALDMAAGLCVYTFRWEKAWPPDDDAEPHVDDASWRPMARCRLDLCGLVGGLHGLYLLVYHTVSRRHDGAKTHGGNGEKLAIWQRAGGTFLTFHLVLLTWVFFRAPGFRASLDYIGKMFDTSSMAEWLAILPLLIVPWALSLGLDWAQARTGRQAFLLEWGGLRAGFTTAVLVFLVLLAFGRHAPFIYFQF